MMKQTVSQNYEFLSNYYSDNDKLSSNYGCWGIVTKNFCVITRVAILKLQAFDPGLM